MNDKTNTLDYYFSEMDKHGSLSQSEINHKIDYINAEWMLLKRVLFRDRDVHKFILNEWKTVIEENKLVCRMSRAFAQAKESPEMSVFINERMNKLQDLTESHLLYDLDAAALLIWQCDFTQDIIQRAYQNLLTIDMSSEYLDETYERIIQNRNDIVNANLKLVVHFAKDYQNLGISLSDLIQEGNLGLLRSIETFDTSKNLKFATFAVWWIRQGFLKTIRKSNRLIRIPHYVQETLARIAKKREELRKLYGMEPNMATLASSENLTEGELEILYNISMDPISLEAVIRSGGEGDGEKQLKDFLPDPSVDLEEDLSNFKLSEALNAMLDAHLTLAEKEVIIMRFGLFKQTAMTLEEIANLMQKSRERIRQIEATALAKLKDSALELKDYL